VDIVSGTYFKFARTKNKGLLYKGDIEITQEIKQSESSAAKLVNFDIAINNIEEIQINPNELFSFWEIVGRPSKGNRFVESRSIVDGVITPTYDGGLCQLSGLIYHAAILANLEVLERYNHSKDIYTDETRFTPLGSDATVVYGFKDLKIKNNLKKPIRFSFLVDKNSLTIRINSDEVLAKNTIEFSSNNKNEVTTYCNGKQLTVSHYK